MSLLAHTTKEKELLARLMRSEAVGEGNLGMLMVGNVVVNRAIASCLTFKNIRTISNAIYQANAFSGKDSPLFFSNPTSAELRLAERNLRGDYFFPATHSLWFYSPKTGETCRTTWWDQPLAGRFKNHCFYKPYAGNCKELY